MEKVQAKSTLSSFQSLSSISTEELLVLPFYELAKTINRYRPIIGQLFGTHNRLADNQPNDIGTSLINSIYDQPLEPVTKWPIWIYVKLIYQHKVHTTEFGIVSIEF